VIWKGGFAWSEDFLGILSELGFMGFMGFEDLLFERLRGVDFMHSTLRNLNAIGNLIEQKCS